MLLITSDLHRRSENESNHKVLVLMSMNTTDVGIRASPSRSLLMRNPSDTQPLIAQLSATLHAKRAEQQGVSFRIVHRALAFFS